jgi:hypothetical protein
VTGGEGGDAVGYRQRSSAVVQSEVARHLSAINPDAAGGVDDMTEVGGGSSRSAGFAL